MNKGKPMAILMLIIMALFSVSNTSIANPDCSGCAVPTNVTAINITNTTADISWTPGSSCNNFEVWVTDNFNNTSNIYPVTGTLYQVTNLSPLTTYTICVTQVSTDLVSCASECVDIHTTGEGIGCDNCDPPIAIVITNITNTTAQVDWFPANQNCDDFYVYLENIATGDYKRYVVVNATTFTLTGLTPGTPYYVHVANIVDEDLSCIATTAEFQTTHEGLPCYDCAIPEDFSVTSITGSSAYVSWHATSDCREFEVWIVDNITGATQSFFTTNTYFNFTGLTPSTSYTVYVATKNYGYPPLSCAAGDVSFTTQHCANFNQSFSFYTQRLYFGETQTNVLVDIPYSVYATGPSQSPTPAASYMLAPGTYTLAKNTSHVFAWDDCQHPWASGGTKYISVWLDYNNNGVYEPSEKVTHHSKTFSANSSSMYNCLSQAIVNNPPNFTCNPCSFTTPNQTLSNIRGRCIISINQAPGACSTFSDGQVLDFVVNIQ